MIKIKQNQIANDLDLLGQELSRARTEKNITLADAANRLQINIRYLEAIEKGRLRDLPAGIYGKKFLSEYAHFLGIDASDILATLDQDKVNGQADGQARLFSVKKPHFRFFLTIPKLAKNLLIVATIVVCLGYLGLCFKRVTAPPVLTVDYPGADIVQNVNSIEIRGTAEPDAKITVNGDAVLTGADGNFSKTISLKTGLNTVIVTAQKQYSRQVTITRNVMVKAEDL